MAALVLGFACLIGGLLMGSIGLIHSSETPAQSMTPRDWLLVVLGIILAMVSAFLLFPRLGQWIDRGTNSDLYGSRGRFVGFVVALSFFFASLGVSVLIIRFVLHRE